MEDKAMKLILNRGETGILQATLWKELETTSREGSRLAIGLEEKGLIKRKKELVNGRWTYRLYATTKGSSLRLQTLKGCPCFTCPDLTRCGNLQSISPVFCDNLDHWLQKIARNIHREAA